MSERTILINTYDKLDNVLAINASIILKDLNQEIPVPGSQMLNLYKYFLPDGSRLNLRASENQEIELKFKILYKDGYKMNDLTFLVDEHENLFETLAVRVQATCRKSKWCSTQQKLLLSAIGSGEYFALRIPLSEIKESITIKYFITREKGIKNVIGKKAQSQYSILSTGEEIKIFVDEPKDIGGNHFPIHPKSGMGSLLFTIEGLDRHITLPEIFYNDELKDDFNQDDSLIVNATFLAFSFYILDTYLKWLIFHSSFDDDDKDFKSLLELYSNYCLVSKNKIAEIINLSKYSEEQTKCYMELSQKLFMGIQDNKIINLKKEIKGLLKEESKLKKYETIQNFN